MRLFPIRHHGPGSARSLLTAFEEYRPDAVLIEGPPDADALIPLAGHPEMQPPVALVLYPPDEPRRAAYYPFAAFSPEWVAMRWALAQDVPVRFMDLPQTHQLDLAKDDEPDLDPLGELARAAGFEDGERWWEFLVEGRGNPGEVFEAITEAMAALREGRESPRREALREAWMRKTIKSVKAERLAVVCGAWHAPALRRPVKGDDKLLKGLPRTKVEATWVPWTFGRLASESGYGAGVESPEYYTLVWETPPEQLTVHWMSRAARLLREEDLSASSASSVEAVRLAETLASLRGLPLAGLAELMESAEAVFGTGGRAPMRLIRDRLVVGQRLGAVPADAPTVPLARDLEKIARRLRLKQEASGRQLELDLRKPNDLERSQLLHRLGLLEVAWGDLRDSRGLGTFRETWLLEWRPELAVRLIEAATWGNTVEEAASARARHDAGALESLPEVTELADQVLLAELGDPLDVVLARLESLAALAADLGHLMDALPRIARMLRYPNVRGTDVGLLQAVLDGLVARITVGLPLACASLDDEAAERMLSRIVEVDRALETHRSSWETALAGLAAQEGLHGLVIGRAVWILLDRGLLSDEEVALRLSRALSSEPPAAAAWVEGLLRGNGALLVHTESLFGALDDWVGGLHEETFGTVLPLLRRTFSTFSSAERRMLGERARHGRQLVKAPTELDEERASRVVPILRMLLG